MLAQGERDLDYEAESLPGPAAAFLSELQSALRLLGQSDEADRSISRNSFESAVASI
jgi:hypothetical protein